MKVKKQKGIYIASFIAIFSATTFSLVSHGKQINNQCCPTVYKTQVSISQCQASNKSWFSWLTGNSRSAQFHYLDLLELLSNSENKDQNNSAITSHFK
ncbi:hypothetical protein [Pseudoalteromonas denitrificans]|jgi:hypothetical protein|uniref:Uncharacterized protein n=1 Tax=Pseudoalteromonas denitrificans DSM 6059 TaxID=1123010 RepID=A0A1I1JYQ3_9GAMM|nr:hypothetical protein [Pseudoalteromonas denitrificans]SFC53062.1 hypothetical protein SAMN02745724_01884 [Pseudoalteromonas denitrificans DSM 6059]